MSHFKLLVVGENVEEQLKPYQENNCGNCPEEFLKFFDVEDEYREKWENGTTKSFYCSSHSSWGICVGEDNFNLISNTDRNHTVVLDIDKNTDMGSYFKADGKYRCYGRTVKIDGRSQPEEHIWIEVMGILKTDHPDKNICFDGKIKARVIDPPVEVLLKDEYPTFEALMKDYAGYDNPDPKTGKYGYWENPNAKWDWYEMGGRWAGYFPLKTDATGETGRASWGMKEDPYLSGNVDQARKGDIDFDKMREEVVQGAIETWDKYYNECSGDMGSLCFILGCKVDDTKESYVERRRNEYFSAFAVLMNGEWFEKGEMGWWGIVSDEKDDWHDQFVKLIDNLPDDTLLTIMDCHI